MNKTLRNLGLAALVAGATYYGCKRDHRVEPITNFNDDVVLIACDNSDEYNGVIKTLTDRNNLLSEDRKLTFTERNRYMKVTVPNEHYDGSLKNTYIHVVRKDNIPKVIDTMLENNIKYDIMQFLGPDRTMYESYALARTGASDNVIIFFGGRNSDKLAEKVSKENVAAIGGKNMRESSRNIHYLSNLINCLGTDNADDWSELENSLKNSDKSFNHYIPNDKKKN